MLLSFGLIDNHVELMDFDCGILSLNDYLQKHALVNQSRKLSVTMVAHAKDDKCKKVIGYYTLSPAQIESDALPKKISRSLPKYPIPAIRLCRLAVDQQHQSKGYGKDLLVHALIKCYQQSEEIGGYCVLVDALNDTAQAFYKYFGFHPLQNFTHSLYIPMKAVETLSCRLL